MNNYLVLNLVELIDCKEENDDNDEVTLVWK